MKPGYRPSEVTVTTYVIRKSQVTQPYFDPPSGIFSWPVTVTLATKTPGAQIYYTLDGRRPEPGQPGTKLYLHPFTVYRTGMVLARAFKERHPPSHVSIAVYRIGRGRLRPIPPPRRDSDR